MTTKRDHALSPLKALEEKWREHQKSEGALTYYRTGMMIYELSAVRETVEQEMAQVEASWRCFHCGDVFTDKHEAREHFGKWATAEPACRLSSEDVTKLRELEDQNDALTRANNVLSNDSRLWYEAESERVRRIGRREWWQELDFMQGRIEAAEAEVERLKAELERLRDVVSPADVELIDAALAPSSAETGDGK